MSCRKMFQELEKSPADKRKYRGIELSNKMKVVLISDPRTDKSAAALSVAVGSMSSPKELPGLAHFCEHMLFLGTKKYKIENEYAKFLSENAGSSNASTARDKTNYYFDVDPKYLRPALDRFSQFFISPLFTESATEREVNAVHSEHENKIKDDGWREYQMDIGTTNPAHPYCHFNTGNRETLWDIPRSQNIDVRNALMEFHKSYYSANLMCLAVLGSESLDELQEMVEEMFSEVENRGVQMPLWPESPYSKEVLGTRIEIVPVEDITKMGITFPFPDTTMDYKDASADYLTHLVEHEGPGSILSLLKSKNWANYLNAGAYVPARGFGTFEIVVSLTTEGLQYADEIILHIFQYLKMLSETGAQKWIWEEMRDIWAIMLRFKDKNQPLSIVCQIARKLHRIPVQEVLSSGYTLTNYQPETIQHLLAFLCPENCRISISSQTFADTATNNERWYGVKYNICRINEDVIMQWKNCESHPALSLPPKNDFIPSKFELKPRESKNGIIPTMTDINGLQRLWFLQDHEFQTPKASIVIEMFSHLPLVDPLYLNLIVLLVNCIEDQLTEYSYAASLAGLHYDVSPSAYGLYIRISGYDHKLPILLKKVMDRILNFEPDIKRFEDLREVYARQLNNWKQNQPYDHVQDYLRMILLQKRWHRDELIEALQGATLEALISFAKKLISKTRLEWVACGNLSFDETKDLVLDVESLFTSKDFQILLPGQIFRNREVNLKSGVNYLYCEEHLTHLSSCTAVFFQTGLQGKRENVVLELIAHICSEPCFNQLRTQEQLGYLVDAYVRRSCGTQGLVIVVQGEKHPSFVETRIDNFLQNFENLLKNMTEKKFLSWRKSYRVEISEKPNNLSDRAGILESEIFSQKYNFDRQTVKLKELETVTLEEIIEYFTKYFAVDSQEKKRLSIHAISKIKWTDKLEDSNELNVCSKPTNTQEKIVDVNEWKKSQSLYSRGKPVNCYDRNLDLITPTF